LNSSNHPFSTVGTGTRTVPNRKAGPFLARFQILFVLRWVLSRKSTRSLPNGISLTIFRGPLARVLTTQSPISYLESLGPNALMSKLDLSDAFRHILSTLVIDVMSDGSTRTGYFFDMFLDSCGGEFSSRPGIVVVSFMRTNGPPPQTWTFTPTRASLVLVPISQGTGATGPSQTTTSPCHVQLLSRSSSLLPLRSILGQHPFLFAISCSIAITYS